MHGDEPASKRMAPILVSKPPGIEEVPVRPVYSYRLADSFAYTAKQHNIIVKETYRNQ